MMDADINRDGTEIVKLSKKLPAMRHGGVVGFVVTEPRVDGSERSRAGIEIDQNLNRFLGRLRRIGLCCRERGQHGQTYDETENQG